MTERMKQLRGVAVRDKIVDTAAELFYTMGIRAVGMDEIVRHFGGAKATLYRWFPTKEALVLAVLERRDDNFWNRWSHTAAQYPDSPLDELRAQISWIQQMATGSSYRGCAFINTAAEFGHENIDVRKRCLAHETKLAHLLLDITTRLSVHDSALLAKQLHIAIVGALALAGLYPDGGPANTLTETTESLILAAHTTEPDNASPRNAAGTV